MIPINSPSQVPLRSGMKPPLLFSQEICRGVSENKQNKEKNDPTKKNQENPGDHETTFSLKCLIVVSSPSISGIVGAHPS